MFRLRGSRTNTETPLILTSDSAWPGRGPGDTVMIQVTSPGGGSTVYCAQDRRQFRRVQSIVWSDPAGKVRAWLVRPGHWVDHPDLGGGDAA